MSQPNPNQPTDLTHSICFGSGRPSPESAQAAIDAAKTKNGRAFKQSKNGVELYYVYPAAWKGLQKPIAEWWMVEEGWTVEEMS